MVPLRCHRSPIAVATLPPSQATLGDYARETYPIRRDIQRSTHHQYLESVKAFEEWAGGPIRLSALDEDTVSRWLFDYSKTVRPNTVRSKRSAIITIWRAACDDGLANEPVLRRIRKTKIGESVILGFTHAEVEKLVATCATIPRWHRCGLRRSVWWDLAIRVAWDTGLRWGDQMELPVSWIHEDGSIASSSSKTSKVTLGVLSETTMAALRASLETCPRHLVTPWMSCAETFRDQFDRIARKAGVRDGCWKWLRRGSGSDVESQQPGAGHEHLGNTERVFRKHYADRAIIGRRIPTPRPLAATRVPG